MQDILFANVDLEIESKEDLQPLLDSFDDSVDVLYHEVLENGNDFASLEFHLNIVETSIYGEPDRTLSAFCFLIENLPPEARKIWDKCDERRFDIGFESGNTEKRYNTKIQTQTIKRIAKLGATIMITIYPILNETLVLKKAL